MTAKSSPPSTHRGHLRRIGGVRRRIPGTVHDGLESLSTIDGIRTLLDYVGEANIVIQKEPLQTSPVSALDLGQRWPAD